MFHQYCIPEKTYFSIIMLEIFTALIYITQKVEITYVGITYIKYNFIPENNDFIVDSNFFTQDKVHFKIDK